MEGLDMTAEETARFQKSLESTEFRNLFFDYMNELSDPAKRALYEKELTMLEQERGVEATWIHPAPEYCLKIATTPKVFVNVCSSDLIDRPASSKQPGGTSWSIPYSLSKFRDDVDHENVACKVYDCVFHPETIQKAFANQAFKRLVSTTAIEGIEKQFEIVLGKDFKELKMKAKGVPQATMIKKADPNFVKKNQTGSEFIQKIIPLQKKMDSVERGPLVKTPAVKKAPLAKAVHIKPPAVQTPTYTIVHQTSYSDYQRFTSNRERQHGQRPDAIVVRIDLPELVSALNINLDITEISFHLDAQDKYILEIQLPFPVDKNNGVAKFDAQKRVLSVTLPVIACQDVPLPISEFDSLKLESPEEAPSPSLVQELNPFHKASPESGLEENGDNSSELNGALIEKVAAAAEPHHAVEATEPISLPELAKKELTQTASPNNVQDLNESIQNISLNPPLKDSKNFLPNAELRPLAPLTFQSSQDDKTITIIIDNRKIKKDTALINIQNQCAELHLSDDEFSYCLDLDFTIALQPEYRIDVSSKNTVVVFYKVVPALITRIIVNNGAAGPTDHYFLTMDNVNEFLGPDRKEIAADIAIKTRMRDDEFAAKIIVDKNRPQQGPKPAPRKQFVNSLLFELE